MKIDFRVCKALENYCKSRILPEGKKDPKWFPASRLSLSEVMTIILLFHLSGSRVEPGSYPPGAPTDPDVPN